MTEDQRADLRGRFFGTGTPRPGGPPVANPRLSGAPEFVLLFPEPPDLDADALTLALRDYHADLAAATAELLPASAESPAVLGLVGWGRHVVKLVGHASPADESLLERCVRPARYDRVLKEDAYRHAAHVRLYYAGYETDPHERFVALAAAAGAVARFGAVVVLNEAAHTSAPAMILLPHVEDAGDMLGALRRFPLLWLFAGFLTIEAEDEPGVWMRTRGADAFGLPDLAFRAEGHHQTEAVFHLFANLLAHQRETGQAFIPGDELNVGGAGLLRLRERTADDWFLQGESPLLVAEPVAPGDATTPSAG